MMFIGRMISVRTVNIGIRVQSSVHCRDKRNFQALPFENWVVLKRETHGCCAILGIDMMSVGESGHGHVT